MSDFWRRTRDAALSDAMDFGMGAAGNFAASLMYRASRNWRPGEGGYMGTGLLARLMEVPHHEAGAAFYACVRGGLVEIVQGADREAMKPTRIRWIGPEL